MIQSFAETDIERIIDLKPEGWDDIRPAFRFYNDASFCQPVKMEEKGNIVALGSLIRFAGTAWLAHIIVAPGWRRKGFGEEMTSGLIAAAENSGCTKQLLVATDMGAPLYEKLGFQTSQKYGFYGFAKRLQKTEIPGVRPMVPADLEYVFKIDQRGSGEERQVLLNGFLQDGWVYTDKVSGVVTGYYLPQLGDGIIVAEDVAAGASLMKLRCMSNENRPVIPANNKEANAVLHAMGCTLRTTARRMVRNGEDPLKPDMLYNRIGGYLG